MIEVILVKYNQPIMEAQAIKSVMESTTDIDYSLVAHQNDPGIGLSKVWNRIIESSTASHICLLNSDTIVTKTWLRRLRETFDIEKNVGTVQPSSNFGNKSTIKVPIPWDEFSWLTINNYARTLAKECSQEIEEIEIGSAFCLMFEKETWRAAGKFDEEFFLFGEDSEFTWRVKEKLGKRLLWRKDAYVHHYGRQSVTKAVEDGEFNYDEIREQSTKLWRQKTGKDVLTGEQI